MQRRTRPVHDRPRDATHKPAHTGLGTCHARRSWLTSWRPAQTGLGRFGMRLASPQGPNSSYIKAVRGLVRQNCFYPSHCLYQINSSPNIHHSILIDIKQSISNTINPNAIDLFRNTPLYLDNYYLTIIYFTHILPIYRYLFIYLFEYLSSLRVFNFSCFTVSPKCHRLGGEGLIANWIRPTV